MVYLATTKTPCLGQCHGRTRSRPWSGRRATKYDGRGKHVLLVELVMAVPTSYLAKAKTPCFEQGQGLKIVLRVVRVENDKTRKSEARTDPDRAQRDHSKELLGTV